MLMNVYLLFIKVIKNNEKIMQIKKDFLYISKISGDELLFLLSESKGYPAFLTLTNVQETTRPSDETEKKFKLLSKSSLCQRT